MTDHPDPSLILMSYVIEDGVPSLVQISYQSLADRAGRQAEFVVDFSVDPSGTVIAVSCYTGKLKVMRLEKGKLKDPFDVS